MNEYDKLYNEIQNINMELNEVIAREILEEFAFNYGIDDIYNIPGSYLNKLFIVLSSEFGEYLIPYLKTEKYNFSPELSFFLVNVCNGASLNNFMYLPSIYSIKESNNLIDANTVFGNIKFNPANRVFKNIENFAVYGRCHLASHSFINIRKDAVAVTSLIPMPFKGKQYHSYIEMDDMILDLSHNCVMDKNSHNLVFQPEVLNKVSGYELETEEKRINSKESLNKGKELLLRLALDKQL